MHRSEHAPQLRSLKEMPAPRLGILGGGQLAKMTAHAAVEFGCEAVILEQQADFPAHSLDAHSIVGDWEDPDVLSRLAGLVDVVTLENEFVPIAFLERLAGLRMPVWPSAATMKLVQDKCAQKTVFAGQGLPVPRFAPVPAPEAARAFGFPLVLKKRLGSYDGRGNATVHAESGLADAWRRLDGGRHPLYAEEFCRFDMELAIIVTRGRDGSVVRYPVVETVNREHICHEVKAPASIPASVADEVARIAERAVVAVDGVGSFGMEFFYARDGRLWVNEIAPRVHNTGHYTIEACVCSQFENHVRAVLGWPLGPAAMVAPAAAMVNLLGYGPGPGAARGFTGALAVPGAHVHVYGKTLSARGRKMGHVTALGASPDEALALARRAADNMRFGA